MPLSIIHNLIIVSRLLLLLIFISAGPAKASWDFKAEQLFRSFPTGFYLKANGGYSLKFWKSKSDFLYGYVRPSLQVQTSAVVNVVNPHLDFNPISFVNLFAGYSYTNRNLSEISNFNCEDVICRGKLKRKYYGSRIALTFKKFLLLTGVRWTRVHLQNPLLTKGFADELSSTIASPGNDLLTQKTLIFGYQFTEKLLVGYLGQFNHMRNLDQDSKMHILLNRYSIAKNWEISAGPGIFETRTGAKNLTVLSLLNWNFKSAPILAH